MSPYTLEIHTEFDDGTPEKDVTISKSVLKGSEILGMELIEIYPDDLGDMFRFKLKDGREVVLITEYNGTFHFAIAVTLEQKDGRDIPAILH